LTKAYSAAAQRKNTSCRFSTYFAIRTCPEIDGLTLNLVIFYRVGIVIIGHNFFHDNITHVNRKK